MKLLFVMTSTLCLSIAAFTDPAAAQAMKSKVAFNNSIAKKATDQPVGGTTVSYQIKLSGGELDGCAVDIVESLFGREEGKWGIFDIRGDVKCADGGGFSYTSSGSWDGNGFHAAGVIKEGSGTGKLKAIKGRIAQLGGSVSKGDGESFNIAYELVVDQQKA
jgi:hypothetical protein